MPRALILAPLLLAGSALLDTSEASALLRCGGGIVGESDSLERVASACGEPDQRAERFEIREQQSCRGAARIVHVEEWIFDFGPRRLVQALTFENGSLVRIESRGFGAGHRRDARAAGMSDRQQWALVPGNHVRRRER